ncbi:hypothetical protein AVEN_233813-1, partial [Araneus ventricosus]
MHAGLWSANSVWAQTFFHDSIPLLLIWKSAVVGVPAQVSSSSSENSSSSSEKSSSSSEKSS